MRRLRESWLALGGSALIIALSVSSALGAGSAQDTFDNIGEQVSEFARSLAPGQNKDADEPDAEQQPDLEEDEQLDEADEADETDGDAVEADAELEPGDEDFDWSTVSHGFCVSWHAQQDENADTDEETSDETDADAVDADAELVPGDEGYDWSNHGEFVSYWARIGCNESPDDAEEADEGDDEVADAELEPGDEGFDWTTVSHGFCVSWHAHEDETAEENLPEDGEDWKNHGEFVSHWARVGCNESPDEADADADAADEEADEEEDADARAERKAEREAARAERKAEREAARAERERNGSGNGRGRGRP